jgi:hypothetical protein
MPSPKPSGPGPFFWLVRAGSFAVGVAALVVLLHTSMMLWLRLGIMLVLAVAVIVVVSSS